MNSLILFLFSAFCSTSLQSKETIVLTQGNHLFITDVVDQNSREILIASSQLLTKKTIYLYLHSNGGDVLEGNQIIETLHYLIQSGYDLRCIAQKAYSMAFHIFQHCPIRYITDTSTVMQHQISLGVSGNYGQIRSYLAMIEQMNHHHIEHSAKRLQMSYDEFQTRINQDWWVYGSHIIKEHMADKIISVGCDPSLFDVTYRKQGVSGEIIEINGCPLLH